jgi:hypothetical protein
MDNRSDYLLKASKARTLRSASSFLKAIRLGTSATATDKNAATKIILPASTEMISTLSNDCLLSLDADKHWHKLHEL